VFWADKKWSLPWEYEGTATGPSQLLSTISEIEMAPSSIFKPSLLKSVLNKVGGDRELVGNFGWRTTNGD